MRSNVLTTLPWILPGLDGGRIGREERYQFETPNSNGLSYHLDGEETLPEEEKRAIINKFKELIGHVDLIRAMIDFALRPYRKISEVRY